MNLPEGLPSSGAPDLAAPAATSALRALTTLGDDPAGPMPTRRSPAKTVPAARRDYRVIYEVIDGQLIILVVGVGHRREIYRAMP